jgi:outer membrane protein
MGSRLGAWFSGVLLTVALFSTALPAVAQQQVPAPVIIVVDITQILRDAKAAKDVQSQLEKETTAYSKRVAEEENDLKRTRDDLERQRTVLAPDVFNARSQEYQQRYGALDHDVQAKRQALQQTYSESMTKVENAAMQIVSDIAKERKANMVLAKAALLYQTDGLDITAEVTRRLDEKLPTMVVTLPKDGDAAAAPKVVPSTAKN